MSHQPSPRTDKTVLVAVQREEYDRLEEAARLERIAADARRLAERTGAP
jgi:hypothetical protein